MKLRARTQQKFLPVKFKQLPRALPPPRFIPLTPPPSKKPKRAEEKIKTRPVVKSFLNQRPTDNLFSRAYKIWNLEYMEEVAQLTEEMKFDATQIIDLKHFMKDAVFEKNRRKLDFLVEGFEEYSKERKIVHPSMIFLQGGVDHSSTKQVTLMQQCLAEVSNREVCAHLLNWVSRHNLIKYLLEPAEEGQDMLIVEIAAQERVEILNLLFEKIGTFNILEEEEKSLREQVHKRKISSAALEIFEYQLCW